MELPPGFSSREEYELNLAVKRDREADPEGWPEETPKSDELRSSDFLNRRSTPRLLKKAVFH